MSGGRSENGGAVVLGPRAEPAAVLPILGVLAADEALGRSAADELGAQLGGVDQAGPVVPFDRTRYYEPEMGAELRRWYCSFNDLVPATALPRLKAAAWAVEQRMLHDGRRSVNLDPGVLDLHKVVLASFKAGPQKLYLGVGVWADIVLYFDSGAYVPLRWTFPDLRGPEHGPFFAAARQRYKALLRARSEP